MRILLLAFFFGIKHIFSKDTSASENDGKLKLYGLDFSPMPLNNLREQLKDRSIDSDIFYLSKDFQREIFERFSENYDILKPRAEASTEKKNPLTAEEAYLIDTLLPYISSSFDKKRCVHLLDNVCPYAATYAGTNEKLKKLFTEKCDNKNKTCEDAVEKLKEYCTYLNSIYEKNKDFSNDFCSQHYSKCKHLGKVCKNTNLTALCRIIRQECYKKPDNRTQDGGITNTHTVIVDTTVVEVETIDYTHTEVFFAKTVCCGRVHYTTCKSSEPPKPTTSMEPEEEELEEEDEPEESSSSTGTEECVITLTSTVTNNIGETHTTTVTVTPGAKDKINNKDDGTRIELQKAGLVYLIVGIAAGIWTIV